ncbi:16S rRNA (cytosine(967)-C(5))-methyltransferase RsmB [Clostridiales bacterium COT073_COT-073]|nr:16S rRNA (cytosine(967)-C(5))-methyltransferase RsmB [Clostridiales bacterium COT073_COT-073]
MVKKEREIALEILMERSDNHFIKTIYMRKMVEYPYLNTVQKAMIKRLVQGVAEREYTLDYVIRANSSLRLKKIAANVLNILRLSVYQIMYMDKIPEYSIVNEGVELVKKQKQFQAVAFTNAVLHQIANQKAKILNEISRLKDQKNWKVAYSFPQELIDLLLKEYSPKIVEKILAESLKEKPLTLRFITPDQQAAASVRGFLQSSKRIVGQGILFDRVCKYYGNIEQESIFQQGYLQIQDEASMLVGHLAAADQPKSVYDLCAAPGGKSTHLAVLLPDSQIMATDVSPEKAQKIKENKNRLKLANLQISVQDATLFDPEKKEADCVLADVPCSGLGVIGSKPEIKYRINQSAINELNQIQSQILEQAAKYVKNGGTLFYSTCTILSAENRLMVEKFLQKHPEFSLCSIADDPIFQGENAKQMEKNGEMIWQNQMLQILPQSLHGFFIAKLRKTL